MGLDMYLTAKKYIGSNRWSEEGKKRGVLEIKAVDFNGNEMVIKHPENIKGLSFDVGYWRKANQIHNWFVNNVQDGVDDCKEYYVSDEKLKELLDIVNKILEESKLVDGKVTNGKRLNADGEWENILEDGKNIENSSLAEKLLPCSEGFFFGGTEYDEYYIQDLEDTKKILETALSDEYKDMDFYYESSW